MEEKKGYEVSGMPQPAMIDIAELLYLSYHYRSKIEAGFAREDEEAVLKNFGLFHEYFLALYNRTHHYIGRDTTEIKKALRTKLRNIHALQLCDLHDIYCSLLKEAGIEEIRKYDAEI